MIQQLLTPYGEAVNKTLPLDDYPRPQFVRDNWQNLNGEWDYAICKSDEVFSEYTGKILVPFSPESSLSGVGRVLLPDETLYYRREFTFHKTGEAALLHFGAVDYACTITLNGLVIARHKGGYTGFTLNVSGLLKEGSNVLELAVTDPTDTGCQACGKQKLNRGGIWYTPQSGIWQTVWLEQTVKNYIKRYRYTPDVDAETLTVELTFAEEKEGYIFSVEHGGREYRYFSGGENVTLKMGDIMRLWSPEDPYLYRVKITTQSGEIVRSYFAMRKISTEKIGGFTRIMLNNKPYFQKGLLDQGYWSDGLYTAPSDEAMICDIKTMKDLGFNMLRKHIKVEPLRWYYHCDRLGMLVWQDIVSGSHFFEARDGKHPVLQPEREGKKVKKKIVSDGGENYDYLGRDSMESRAEYRKEAEREVKMLYNTPSVVLWTTFNEGWGQFDANYACAMVKEWDKTRLVDHASGWFDQGGGDVNSIHNYSKKPKYRKYSDDDGRALVLSEYGGLTFRPDVEHVFDPDALTGYRRFRGSKNCTKAFVKLQKRLQKAFLKEGLCASVYTQVSDVEDELNGMLTYDRKVLKMDARLVRKANDALGKVGK